MASLVKDSTGLRTEEGKWQCEGGAYREISVI